MRKSELKIKHFLWKIKNIFHKYSKEDKELIKKNKKLIKEFPFLRVRVNRFGKVPTNYDYTYTELDDMPTAWRESFGIEMCEKIKKCLLKADYLDKYVITQIKEKYGTLRWYDYGVPKTISDEFSDIINYYEDKSMLVCIETGKPTKYITTGWISYISEDCFKEKIKERPNLGYFELTWKDIPVRTTYYPSGEKVIKESQLKGDMMVTWKRYSKHNNKFFKYTKYNLEDLTEPKETIIKTGLWKQE